MYTNCECDSCVEHAEGSAIPKPRSAKRSLTAMRRHLKALALPPGKIATGDDTAAFRDLLTDAMHLARTKGFDFDDEFRMATDNFNAEV